MIQKVDIVVNILNVSAVGNWHDEFVDVVDFCLINPVVNPRRDAGDDDIWYSRVLPVCIQCHQDKTSTPDHCMQLVQTDEEGIP